MNPAGGPVSTMLGSVDNLARRSGVDTRPVVLVSPDLRASVLGVAHSLVQAGLLHRYVTTVAFPAADGRGPLARLLRRFAGGLPAAAASRQVPDWLAGRVRAYPTRELIRLAAQRSGLSDIACDRIWEWAETGFDRRVARDWAGRAPCLYGCEHASLETFRRQRAAGGYNLLWQVIAHHRFLARTLAKELERFPEAATPYVQHALRSAARINARKDEQYELADLIVANSEFVRRTFLEAGVAADKVVAVPTGCPPVAAGAAERRSRPAPGAMVFLCAGTQSLRKGTHVLLEAWRRLSPRASAELWLVGKSEVPERLHQDLPPSVIVRPPVPRAELARLFARASVFVLPTFCEGRAHVVLEALAHGLPVVTTECAGCGDVVRDGFNGWVVPAGDSEALVQRLSRCLQNPDEVCAMGLASLECARSWQVDDFARAHAAVVGRFLAGRGVKLQPA